METRKYKTIEGLLSQCWSNEMNYNEFMARQFYHEKSMKWYKFDLPEYEIERAVKLFANVVYSRVTKRQFDNVRYYCGQSYGILQRLTIQKKYYDKTVRGTYCAGQDYDSEIRTIQTILREC